MNPPRLALRLAETLIDQRVREAIVGDLVERFQASPSRSWFWRETLFAIAHFPTRPRLWHPHGDGIGRSGRRTGESGAGVAGGARGPGRGVESGVMVLDHRLTGVPQLGCVP
jgi:hypothetical protein